jgi:hypothetical protein
VFLARRVLPFVVFFFGVLWAYAKPLSGSVYGLVVLVWRGWLVFLFSFLGGDAKSRDWGLLDRRVLHLVSGFFCCLFWGRCQI